MADQSKTNVTGRVDEHGIFRHRIPELCGFAGIGFYLFSQFHILGSDKPNFAPDFDDPNCTEYGRRDWYKLFLFPGKGKQNGSDSSSIVDSMEPMSYDSKSIVFTVSPNF